MIWSRLEQAALLAVQAVQVIRRTPRLPEAEGPRDGVVGEGVPLRLLIVGDSSAAGVGAERQSEALSGHLTQGLGAKRRVTWQLIARTGWTTRAACTALHRHPPSAFDIAVTALGVNDVTRMIGRSRWRESTRRLHRHLREAFEIRRLYVTTIPPLEQFRALPPPLSTVLGRHGAELRGELEQLVGTTPDLRLIAPDWGLDPRLMAADGFHPGPEIYRAWGRHASRVILDDLRHRPL